MIPDTARIHLVQEFLRENSLEALVCSLPANVLLLTGYWPVVGKSVAVAARGQGTIVLVPEDERELAEQGWADEIHTFEPGSLHDLRTPFDAVREPLCAAAKSLNITKGNIGCEGGGMSEPSSYAAMYLYGPLVLDLPAAAFPAAHLTPITEGLMRLRSVKTPREIDHIRLSCRLAAEAFDTAAPLLRPGMSEAEAATHFQRPLGDAKKELPGPGRIGGFTFCMSGPNSAKASGAYAISRRRRFDVNDLVLVHCNSYADGYWTDVTRTYCLGQPDERKHRMFAAVFAARAAALEAIHPGAKASTVDAAARDVLRDYGFGKEFTHSTGHGVGFGAISPATRPRLHPKSDDVLETGMVFNVEPAAYFDGYDGLRHCDMVALTERGAEVLTPFQATPAELVLPPASG